MKPTKMTIQRVEKKYLLTKAQRDAFYEQAQSYLTMDPYGPATIGNIYFDTDEDRLINTSLQKPLYKEKLRLRSYGVPNDDSIVYLEIKKKCKGVVNKRRIALTLNEARAYIHNQRTLPQSSQIAAEIDYFMFFYQPKPKVFIAYDRVPLIGREQNDLRLTFDEKIRRRYDHLDLSYGAEGALLLAEGTTLLEIKVQNAYPLWLSHLLTELKIYPISFSKYGTVYRQDVLRKQRKLADRQTECIHEVPIQGANQKGEFLCLPVY